MTTQTLQAIDGIPAGLPASVVMNQRYYEAVASAGGAPLLIPLLDDDDALRAAYEACGGILIPGGVDMDPATYGEAPHEKLGRIDPARDRVELQLTRWAVEDRKPLLGLCRGLQVINVAAGFGHMRMMDRLNRGETVLGRRWSLGVVVSLILAAVGLVMAAYLFWTGH